MLVNGRLLLSVRRLGNMQVRSTVVSRICSSRLHRRHIGLDLCYTSYGCSMPSIGRRSQRALQTKVIGVTLAFVG